MMNEQKALTQARGAFAQTIKLARAYGWVWKYIPVPTPNGWRMMEMLCDGCSYIHPGGLRVIISGQIEEDGKRWLHCSLSRRNTIPSHDDIITVRRAFLGEDRYAYQVFPPKDRYVNIHPHVLHLWSCVDEPEGKLLPEFSRGGSV